MNFLLLLDTAGQLSFDIRYKDENKDQFKYLSSGFYSASIYFDFLKILTIPDRLRFSPQIDNFDVYEVDTSRYTPLPIDSCGSLRKILLNLTYQHYKTSKMVPLDFNNIALELFERACDPANSLPCLLPLYGELDNQILNLMFSGLELVAQKNHLLSISASGFATDSFKRFEYLLEEEQKSHAIIQRIIDDFGLTPHIKNVSKAEDPLNSYHVLAQCGIVLTDLSEHNQRIALLIDLKLSTAKLIIDIRKGYVDAITPSTSISSTHKVSSQQGTLESQPEQNVNPEPVETKTPAASDIVSTVSFHVIARPTQYSQAASMKATSALPQETQATKKPRWYNIGEQLTRLGDKISTKLPELPSHGPNTDDIVRQIGVHKKPPRTTQFSIWATEQQHDISLGNEGYTLGNDDL